MVDDETSEASSQHGTESKKRTTNLDNDEGSFIEFSRLSNTSQPDPGDPSTEQP